jgi:hypothetical protein
MDHFPLNAYQERAAYCIDRASLAHDELIKRNWNELASDWIELETEKVSKNLSTHNNSR